MNINETIISIDKNSNPDSEYYGKLVKWRDNLSTKKQNKWFYGIGLSDKSIFDTGQSLTIVTVNFPVFIIDFYLKEFSRDEIIERLKYALICMAETNPPIKFNDLKWNDEHLARFIATDNPVSYQVKKEFRRNNKNKKIINDYIKHNNPDLYINISTSRFSLPKFWHRGRFWILVFLTIIYVCLVPFFSPRYLIVIILIILLIIINQLSNYEWSGFHNKQLWNWLELLIIPILLAAGGFFLENQATRKLKLLEDQNSKQESLKEYFKSVQEIIKSSNQKNSSIRGWIEKDQTKKYDLVNNLNYEDKKLIELFTRLVLTEIDGQQKRQVIKFLYELELIRCSKDDLECKKILNLDQVDLTKANLKNLNLESVYLAGVNLKNADLSNTNLELANFKNANLKNTNLKLSRMKNATMSNAFFGTSSNDMKNSKKWKRVIQINSLYFLQEDQNTQKNCQLINKISTNELSKNFKDQDFSQANLEGLDLIDSNFRGADLSGASLNRSNLQNADLSGANLSNIKLKGAYLKGITIDKRSKNQLDSKYQLIINLFENQNNQINLSEKDLSNSNLTGITLQGIDITKKIKFQNTNLTNTKLICATLKNIDMNLSYLFEANLNNARLTDVDLTKTNLSSAKLINTTLKNVNLTNASLFAANLREATIEDSDLKKADLNSAFLCGANLSKAQNLETAELTGAIYDDNTIFPKTFDPKKAGMIKDNRNCKK